MEQKLNVLKYFYGLNVLYKSIDVYILLKKKKLPWSQECFSIFIQLIIVKIQSN